MQLQLHQLALTNKQLAAIPAPDRLFFLLFTNQANEYVMFRKLMIYAAQSIPRLSGETEQLVSNFQMLSLLRSLAGKLFEGWNLIDKRFVKTNAYLGYREYGAMTKSLDKIQGYFNVKNNLIKTIRNDYAHHNAMTEEELHNLLKSFGDEYSFSFIFGSINPARGYQGINTYFLGSEEIISAAVLEQATLAPGVEDTLMSRLRVLIEDILGIAAEFDEFTQQYVNAFFRKHTGQSFDDAVKNQSAKVEDVSVRNLSEITLPFYSYADPEGYE